MNGFGFKVFSIGKWFEVRISHRICTMRNIIQRMFRKPFSGNPNFDLSGFTFVLQWKPSNSFKNNEKHHSYFENL